MSVEINLKPENSWGFFSKNRNKLSDSQIEIASNTATNTSICLTEEGGFPVFNVYRESEKIYDEPAVQADCLSTLRNIYIRYLFPLVVDTKKEQNKGSEPTPKYTFSSPEEEDESYIASGGTIMRSVGAHGPSDVEDEVYEREDKLEMAVYDALTTFVSGDIEAMLGQGFEDILKDMVDDVCESLATLYGISVYRPTWVESEDDDQTLILKEYPYDELADCEQSEDDISPD